MARPTPLPLALALSLGALHPPPAGADDWQVTRSAFDPRVLAPLKARLASHPDDLGTLRRLISLYKTHRSVDQLQRELDERADSPAARLPDLLAAGHLRRERGQLDEARARYEQALRAVAGPGSGGAPAAPAVIDRPALLLLLVDLHLRRAPPDTQAARLHLGEALAALQEGDARRQQALRKAADLAQLAQDFGAAERLYAELLRPRPGIKGPGGRDEEVLRQARADALVRAGRPREALAELSALASRKTGLDRAQALLRVGETQEADKDDLAALATYKAALALLPQGHHLRHDLYDRIVGVHRRREDLPALLRAWEAEWPAARRGFLEWDLLARLHDETGDTDKAVAAYRAALARAPHHIDARRRLIAVLERSGQSPDTVIAEYERLTRDAPGEARTYLELAERLDKAGQRQRALQVLARAAARFASDPSLHAALGDLYGRWGEADLALREAELLVRIAPQDEGHIVNLGEIYWARGRKDKAEEIWRRLLTIGGGRTQGMARLADVYAEHNLMPQAIDLYQKALKAEPQGPQNLQLRRGLALCQERLNRPREAMPLWEGIYFARDAPRPLASEARQHLATLVQKDARARVQFQAWQVRLRGLLDRPQTLSPAALRDEAVPLALLLAETHLRLSRPADAERSLQGVAQALKGQAGLGAIYAEVLLQLVPIYRHQHRLPEAIAALKEAVALQPDRARELYGQLAELSLQTYRDDEAMRYAEQAVTDAQGEMRLGAMLERKDDVERAMAAYRRALAKDERLFAAHMALARLHLQRGQPGDLKEAAARYREVARRAPQEELVLEAGRKAVDLHEYLGTLGELVRDLLPLSHAYPQKQVYRKLLVSLYDRYATPLTLLARRGDGAARAELSRLGQSGLKPLTEALIDGDAGEQRIAVALLGDLGNPSAAPALLKFAEGGPASSPGAPRARQAPSSAPPPPPSPSLSPGAMPGRLRTLQGAGAGSILGVLGTPREFLGLRSGPEIDLRVAALLQAGRLSDPRSAAALVRLSAHEEKKIRLAALYGLLRLPRQGRAEVAALERALSDASPDVQALACLGLGVMYSPGQGQGQGQGQTGEGMPARVRGAMFGLIDRGARAEEGSALLAAACVHGLGQAGQAQAVPLFLNLLREGSEELEAQAAWALGQVRPVDRRAIEPLLRAALLKGGPVREAAAAALWELGGAPRAVTWPEPDGDGMPTQGLPGLEVRRLLMALSPRQPAWPSASTAATAPLWASGEAGPLLSILQEALAGHRDLVLRTLSDLIGAPGEGPIHLGPLDAGAPDAVAAALLPLRQRLGPDLLPALRKLVLGEGGGSDSAVRGQAVVLLSRLAPRAPGPLDEPTVAALEAAVRGDASLEVRGLAAQALVQVLNGGPRVAAALEALLQSQDRRLRLLGLQVLVGAGPGVRGAISEGVLRRAGQDADGYVREATGKLQMRP